MAGTPTAEKATRVKYTGTADVREITAAQWKAAGVEDQKMVRWSLENNFSVPIGDFSAQALEVLERDDNLKSLTD